jgi:hypothetical protein
MTDQPVRSSMLALATNSFVTGHLNRKLLRAAWDDLIAGWDGSRIFCALWFYERWCGPKKPVDFCRSPAKIADAIRNKRPCTLSPELGWHVTELTERLQQPERFDGRHELVSTFDSIKPLSISP